MTEEELKKTRKERDDIRREKDEIIAELQFKIDHMESAYESVLHVCTTLIMFNRYSLLQVLVHFHINRALFTALNTETCSASQSVVYSFIAVNQKNQGVVAQSVISTNHKLRSI